MRKRRLDVKREVVPPRPEVPKLEPTPKAKGFPKPDPRGICLPETDRENIAYSSGLVCLSVTEVKFPPLLCNVQWWYVCVSPRV